MKCPDERGSILIALIVTITVLSVLAAGILSFSANSPIHTVHISNGNRAHHLAESGLRYSRLVNLPENSYLTMLENQDGLLQVFEHSASSADLPTIPTSGFRIAYDDCRMKSTGIIGEGTLFEVTRTLEHSYSATIPCCWRFNTAANLLSPWKDACSGNLAVPKGARWTCEGKIGGGLSFGSGDYVKTDFKPLCGIGNNHSFTVALWARPVSGTDGMAFGVDDGNSRFGLGVSNHKWMWAYGNLEDAPIPAAFDQWQFVYFSYDSFTMQLRLRVQSCSGVIYPPYRMEYGEAGGAADFPEEVKNLFVGAENRNGNPTNFFSGILDEIVFYDRVIDFTDLVAICLESRAFVYYPFNGTVSNESVNGEEYNENIVGAESDFDSDPFGCPDKAYALRDEGAIVIDRENILTGYPFAMSAWFKADPAAGSDRVIMGITDKNSEAVQYGLYLSETKGGRVCLRAGNSDFNSLEICSQTPMDDAKWHFVVGNFSDSNNISFHVDGKEMIPNGFTRKIPFSGVNRLTIGSWGDPAAASGFNGSIDEVAVYHVPLSTEEIIQLYRQGQPE